MCRLAPMSFGAPFAKPIDARACSTPVCTSWRHTLAGRLLNAGGALKEVADVLRHRELDTSLIYAKVDFTRLAAVAMPWPGSPA